MRTAIFIDGGYLQKVVPTKVDYQALRRELGGEQARMFFYDCLPEEANGKRDFLHALKCMGVTVRLGELEEIGPPKYFGDHSNIVQKGVDVQMALDVVEAAQQGMERIVVITGDADLVPAILKARDLMAWVVLVHNTFVAKSLWACVDERVQMDWVWQKKVERQQ